MMRELGLGLVDLLFPPKCLTCGALAEPFCGECRAQIRPVGGARRPDGILEVRSAGYHEGMLREAVLALKFQRKTALVDPLASLLAEELLARHSSWRPHALVPVPIHWIRRLERGFNQAELLAEAAGRRSGVPVVRCLRRVRAAPPQVGLSAAQRRVNLDGAFDAASNAEITGRRLVLVDDVTTTGATLGECARTLESAGAAAVFALTVSRDP